MLVAFGFGFAASRARLPALVGYLAAGFALAAVGFETTATIETLSELGVYLLLFGIGLELRPFGSLIQRRKTPMSIRESSLVSTEVVTHLGRLL
ncbi:MAG: cation:proton antiporter [Acidimicrobiia bacterium]